MHRLRASKDPALHHTHQLHHHSIKPKIPHAMKQLTFWLTGTLCSLLLMVESCSAPAKNTAFVKTNGTQLTLDGKPYRYAGINFWQGAYLAADLIEGGKERLKRELDLMVQSGITNLRVTAASEGSELKMAVRPAFQESPGTYNEELLKGMDYLLDEMDRRGMKAVMVLGNYWQWSGGMAQMQSWQTGKPVFDPDVTGDWHGFMCNSAEFYSNRAAWPPYFDYIRHLILRTNTVNQKPYRNDATIMSWQLANEPRPHPNALNDSVLRTDFIFWVDSAARFIHALAPNQLVSTGNEGLAGSLQDSALYIQTHQLASIDYTTFHIWPKNWSWFNASDAETTLPIAIEKTRAYFQAHEAFAKQLGKPAVLEEFGIGRDGEKFEPSSPTAIRNIYLSEVFKMIETGASHNGPVVGCNVWAWGGEGKPHNPEAIWIENTDFTGDPPQEPQGLNSVFSTDTLTLELFKQHAHTLSK